jgi:glycosidase
MRTLLSNIPSRAALLALAFAAALPGAAYADGARAYKAIERPIQDELIYFVMPDRFANGDPGNDRGGIAGDADHHGFDPSHKGFFHGGDLDGLRERLDYLQGMGITAIWVTPIFKNKAVQGAPGQRSAGYHGYWITDFTQVDPHLGGNAAFTRLVDAAHARGMKVIMDIVTNHSADVIQYRECGVSGDLASGDASATCPYRPLADYPYTTRGGKQGEPINPGFAGDAPAVQTAENFARLRDPGFAYSPFVAPEEAGIKVPAWLNDPIYYHNRGNSTFKGESSLYGDFAGLDDLFTEHPRVLAGMIDIYKQWISEFRIDGFRIDTAKHVNDSFWQGFIPAIRAHAKAEGIPDFYVFGEVFDFDPRELSRFTREAAFPAVLDFAFQGALRDVVADGKGGKRLQTLFKADALYADGANGAAILPIFSGNHDMGRIGHFLMEASAGRASDDELLRRATLANALLLFARGVPVIYYGDEQGFTGDGNDQHAREDMFPSQVASYNDNRLIGSKATTAADNFDREHPLYRAIAAMAQVRRDYPGLARGGQIVRLAGKKAGLFAFSRIDRSRNEEFLVVVNNRTEADKGTVEVSAGSAIWNRLIGEGDATLRAHRGRVRVALPGLSYAVYRATIPAG